MPIWHAKRKALKLSLRAQLCRFVSKLHTETSLYIELNIVSVVILVTSLECQGKTLSSVGSISCMHWSEIDVPNNTSMARFLAVLNPASTSRSPMWKNGGTMPSMYTNSWFAVCSCGGRIDLAGSFQGGRTQSLLIKLGCVPVFSILATVHEEIGVTPIRTLSQYVALQKMDTTSCRPTSNCTWETCGSVRDGN